MWYCALSCFENSFFSLMTLISVSCYRAPKMDLFLVLLCYCYYGCIFFSPFYYLVNNRNSFVQDQRYSVIQKEWKEVHWDVLVSSLGTRKKLNKATVRTFLLLEVEKKNKEYLSLPSQQIIGTLTIPLCQN